MRPPSIEEALEYLDADDDAVLLAGGQSLVPMLNLRLARPGTLVDISRLGPLKGITSGPDGIEIGAMTPHSVVESHSWSPGLAALPRAISQIGYPQIRHRGTIGGSIAHADPAAECPTVLVALDATVRLQSTQGTRSIASEEFHVGYYTTARDRTEMVTSVHIPTRAGLRTGFHEFSRRVGDFAIALAAVAVWGLDGERHARVVVGGLDVRPRRVTLIEEALASGANWQGLCTPEAVAAFTDPADDIHASAEYRLRLGAEVIRRAIGQIESDL